MRQSPVRVENHKVEMKTENLEFWAEEDDPHFFHPAVCRDGSGLLMTLQTFEGCGDTYGPVMVSTSGDAGVSWSAPTGIPALKTVDQGNGIREGVADVRPFFHPKTGSVLAIGCTTFYGKGGHITEDHDFDQDRYRKHPVYAIKGADGIWSERKVLTHGFFEDSPDWRVACPQLVVLPDGDVIVPVYFRAHSSRTDYSVCTIRCTYDGRCLKVEDVGTVLNSNRGRGLLEPSIAMLADTFYLTVRAEDDCGYLATSTDGLNWGSIEPWRWDDGTVLTTSTTQQHWLAIADRLFLVYTRKDETNGDVMRWRSPLFMAELDPIHNCLVRATEQTVLPLIRREGNPNLLGNFHVSSLTSDTSMVSDASLWIKIQGDRITEFRSSVWLARVTADRQETQNGSDGD